MLIHFSCVQLFVTLWTVACQAPLSMGILQARILDWVAVSSSRGSSWPKDRTLSLMSPALAGGFFTTSATWEAPCYLYFWPTDYKSESLTSPSLGSIRIQETSLLTNCQFIAKDIKGYESSASWRCTQGEVPKELLSSWSLGPSTVTHGSILFPQLRHSLNLILLVLMKASSHRLLLLLLLSRFSRVQLFTTPWTAAYQAPPPMGFSKQEYWSGVPLPSLHHIGMVG